MVSSKCAHSFWKLHFDEVREKHHGSVIAEAWTFFVAAEYAGGIRGSYRVEKIAAHIKTLTIGKYLIK